jgi:hypothetical protein
MNNDQLKTLWAKELIREIYQRYARGIDRCDGELLKTVYWPDAVEDHAGFFKGRGYELMAQLLPRLRAAGGPNHRMFGQIAVDLDGDTANVEAYFFGFNRFIHDQVAVDLFAAGRYLDRVEQRDGEWRVAARSVVFDWFKEVPALDLEAGIMGAPRTLSKQFPDDQFYTLFARSAAS